MEYYSAIKKKTFESILMRWMKLEPIIQSEVRKKNTIQYANTHTHTHTHTHTYIWNLERW